jgi:murein DD-endopeptidase MepM/ murein hydrolase activator NlpD
VPRHPFALARPRPSIVALVGALCLVLVRPVGLDNVGQPRLESVRDARGAAPASTPEPPPAASAVAPRKLSGRARLGEPVRPLAPGTLTGYRWPLPRGRLTLPYGPSPWGSRVVGGEQFHDGIDLATFCGDRIVAAHSGRVMAAGRRYDEVMGWRGDLGPYLRRLEKKSLWMTLPIVVVVDDGNGYRSIYAHFGRLAVKRGQQVQAGQLIGYEGATGRASGCHLHYGLFAPTEQATFGIRNKVVKRMRLPALQTARIDPLFVLPARAAKPAIPSSAAAGDGMDEEAFARARVGRYARR